MTENKTTTPKKKAIDYVKVYHDLLNHKRLYYIVLPVAFALSALYMLSIPNNYTCKVKLSPELSNRSSSTSSLASLASSFGVKLGSGMGSGSDALFPTLYPDLMASVDFKADIFKIKVHPEDANQEYSYYEYRKDIKKRPLLNKLLKSFFSLFKSDESETVTVINPRKVDIIISRLHVLMEGKTKPKDVMMPIRAAIDAGVIRRPTSEEFYDEFGKERVKGKSSVDDYTNPDKTPYTGSDYLALVEEFKGYL